MPACCAWSPSEGKSRSRKACCGRGTASRAAGPTAQGGRWEAAGGIRKEHRSDANARLPELPSRPAEPEGSAGVLKTVPCPQPTRIPYSLGRRSYHSCGTCRGLPGVLAQRRDARPQVFQVVLGRALGHIPERAWKSTAADREEGTQPWEGTQPVLGGYVSCPCRPKAATAEPPRTGPLRGMPHS